MAFLNHIFLGILILQIYVHAAPSDVSKLEDIAKVELSDKVDSEPKEVEEGSSSPETLRQKRFYNPYGYGFPPLNPVIYPNFNKRDDFSNTGTYGVEDPLLQIHRRVQEIANVVRQPLPPQIPHIPIFYPVLFVPPFDCRCNPINPQPTGPSSPDNNQSPNITNRFPEMEDERQNWGIVINNTNDDQGGQDYSRPISFDPVRPIRPNTRPPPPVEHGTLQGDAADSQNPQSGGESAPSLPPSNALPPSSASQGSSFNAPSSPFRPQNGSPPGGAPSPCDGAILTCCHQPQVVYDCFALQGCPNFTSYGNPCDANSILRVIERFQQYYGTRSG